MPLIALHSREKETGEQSETGVPAHITGRSMVRRIASHRLVVRSTRDISCKDRRGLSP